MPFGDPQAETLRRLIGGKSDRVTLDKSGRICLPDPMAKAAGIGKDAKLVGLVDRFEIWSMERYKEITAADEVLSSTAYKMV